MYLFPLFFFLIKWIWFWIRTQCSHTNFKHCLIIPYIIQFIFPTNLLAKISQNGISQNNATFMLSIKLCWVLSQHVLYVCACTVCIYSTREFVNLCVYVCILYTWQWNPTFSQKVLEVPSGVVLWVLQMDVSSPPCSRRVVRGLQKSPIKNLTRCRTQQ